MKDVDSQHKGQDPYKRLQAKSEGSHTKHIFVVNVMLLFLLSYIFSCGLLDNFTYFLVICPLYLKGTMCSSKHKCYHLMHYTRL